MKTAITSATGKLGGGVLNAILENNLINPEELIVCTSSDPKAQRFDSLRAKGIDVRRANFEDYSSLVQGFSGCEKLLLVSLPFIEMDYDNAPLWQGREKHYRAAIDAAIDAGVGHIYYTSLAFATPTKAGVMRAHERTEDYLSNLEKQGKFKVTIIREGLYSEAWPLAFGYYSGLKNEDRREIVVAGDGALNWTTIADMAFGTAKVVAAPSEKYSGKTLHMCQRQTCSLQGIADLVSKLKGQEISLKFVNQKEFEEYYISRGVERANVEWWSSAYKAFDKGECTVEDPILNDLLEESGRTPVSFESIVREMMK